MEPIQNLPREIIIISDDEDPIPKPPAHSQSTKNTVEFIEISSDDDDDPSVPRRRPTSSKVIKTLRNQIHELNKVCIRIHTVSEQAN